ncbi:tyrosine-type recombinase/integrase [Aeromonas veronii]|uniref:tyrosine-type recombinase/integrase n=1 Tax=Aeromonas veronii TaxID=654 RepID=UPI003B9FD782
MNTYILVGNPSNGILLDQNSNPFKPFSNFINGLKRRGYSNNTINAYGQHVARFINYISYASDICNKTININTLRDIICSYSEYLLHGVDAKDLLARKIAQDHNKTRTTRFSSMTVIETAIAHYIEMGELEQLDEGDNFINSIFPHECKAISEIALLNRKNNGFLGGLISQKHQSKITSRISLFPYYKRRINSTQRRFFPYQYISEFINNAYGYRDKCLYALLAASGCRMHEALQLTLDDIDINSLRVSLTDFRCKECALIGLTQDEKSMLAWKGRATNSTFLIEPYRSQFFEHLTNYMRYERDGVVNHHYIFQNKNNHRPYFTSHRQAVIKNFKRNLMNTDIDDISGLSPHSLRHSYGRYILNYLPLPDGGFGLPLAWVKILMGHSSISSTEVYAKKDENLLNSILAYSNQTVLGQSNPTDIEEIHIAYLREEISRINNEIIMLEGNSNG